MLKTVKNIWNLNKDTQPKPNCKNCSNYEAEIEYVKDLLLGFVWGRGLYKRHFHHLMGYIHTSKNYNAKFIDKEYSLKSNIDNFLEGLREGVFRKFLENFRELNDLKEHLDQIVVEKTNLEQEILNLNREKCLPLPPPTLFTLTPLVSPTT